jgi:hypothetical protein
LGVIPGRVIRFAAAMHGPDGRPLKVPQIGWNQLHHGDREADPLLAGVPDGAYAYFVHSYYCAPLDAASVLATTDFGMDYASVVPDNVRASVPQKGQAGGLEFWNFVTSLPVQLRRVVTVTIIIYRPSTCAVSRPPSRAAGRSDHLWRRSSAAAALRWRGCGWLRRQSGRCACG